MSPIGPVGNGYYLVTGEVEGYRRLEGGGLYPYFIDAQYLLYFQSSRPVTMTTGDVMGVSFPIEGFCLARKI